MGPLSAAVVSLLAALTSAESIPSSNLKRHVSQIREEYDFVIVGAGTGGLTVADRLSAAFSAKSVLVVEYGDIEFAPGIFDPPADWLTAPEDGPPSWRLTSLPNPDMGNRTASVQAGQVVGGTSAINGQFFDRGSRFDYDAWAEVGGVEALQSPVKWNWDGIFPYFKKSVTFTEPALAVAQQCNYTWNVTAYGGTTPIYSTYASFQWADQSVLTEAWKDMGVNPVQECAGGDKEGICWVPGSQHPVTGLRSHAGLGHYADVQPRANYELLVKHQVVRVVYRNGPLSDPPLVEVRSLVDDSLFNITVRGEVIVAAGALHTPTVLQRSGIGPASFLSSRAIPVVVDLPGVGSNLQDHSGPPVTWNYTAPYDTEFWPLPSEIASNATFKAEAIAAFEQGGPEHPASGPYTLTGSNSAVYVSLPHLAPDDDDRNTTASIVAKIRAMAHDGNGTTAASYLPPDVRTYPAMVAGYRAQLLVLADLLENPKSPSFETPWGTSQAPVAATAFMLHPLSRGTVRLDPADPLAPPVLDYRAGTNPVDVDVHVAHLRFLRRLLATPTMRRFGAVEITPGDGVDNDDHEALADYVKTQSSLSLMHPCCTAAMMPRDRGGVVGPDLKVHGARGLRVVDASVMALEPSGHLSSTVYAIGEKAADIIIEEWQAKGW